MPEIVRVVRKKNLTYLDEDALHDLYEAIVSLEQEGLDGLLIEAGCALGGSAIVMATAKSQARQLNVYDVFGMIPPPSEKDDDDVHDRYAEIKAGRSKGLGNDTYYGYEEDLLQIVRDNFEQHDVEPTGHHVQFLKGLFQDTMQLDEPVALAHIDGDWYDSVMTCLERIVPNLHIGGRLIIDDYDHWSGCRKAVDDYFADKRVAFDFVKLNRLHIVRKA